MLFFSKQYNQVKRVITNEFGNNNSNKNKENVEITYETSNRIVRKICEKNKTRKKNIIRVIVGVELNGLKGLLFSNWKHKIIVFINW